MPDMRKRRKIQRQEKASSKLPFLLEKMQIDRLGKWLNEEYTISEPAPEEIITIDDEE